MEYNSILIENKEETFRGLMKESFNYLNDKTFELCYNEAWNRGHAWGLNTVQDELTDIVDFVLDIIKANKGN